MPELTVVKSWALPQFDPTPDEARTLAEIRTRESNGDYAARNPKPGSTAAGAYQFTSSSISPTWQLATKATGAPVYSSAAEAPQIIQDANALHMLRKYGPNSTTTWAASGPYKAPAPAETSQAAPAAPLTVVKSWSVPPTPPQSIGEQLKNQGFLDSAWGAIKGQLSTIKDVFTGEYSRQTAEQIKQFHELEKNGTPEQKREFAKQVVFSNIPFASTIFKATQGNLPGAAGDIAGMAALPIVAKAVPAAAGAIKTGAGVVADVARSPVAADVVGVVSPRAANLLRVYRRGANAVESIQEVLKARQGPPAAPPATSAQGPPPLQLPPGPVIPPAPADASFVRGVPAQYAQPEPVPPSRQLGPGPIVTPPPPDASFVRAVPAEYPPVEFTPQEQALADHILQNVEPQTAPAAPAAPAESPLSRKPAAAELAQQFEATTRPDRMLDFLKRMDPEISAAAIDNLDPNQWELVARGAGSPAGTIPTAEDIASIRGNLAQPEGATQITAKTPDAAKAQFEQNREIRTNRKGPATATAPTPATDLETQLADSLAGKRAAPPPEGPAALTAAEERVEAYAQHLAADTENITPQTLADLPKSTDALLTLEALGKRLGIKGRPASLGEVQQIVDRVKQLRGEGQAAPQTLRTMMEGEKPATEVAAPRKRRSK